MKSSIEDDSAVFQQRSDHLSLGLHIRHFPFDRDRAHDGGRKHDRQIEWRHLSRMISY